MNTDVGKSSAGDRLKRAHKAVCPSGPGGMSLKAFVRHAIKSKSEHAQDAQDWLSAKAGGLNQSRSDATLKRMTEERLAKKAAQSKKK